MLRGWVLFGEQVFSAMEQNKKASEKKYVFQMCAFVSQRTMVFYEGKRMKVKRFKPATVRVGAKHESLQQKSCHSV